MSDFIEKFYIGIDVGGTFTDVTCINESENEFVHLKAMTTGGDPALAVIQSLQAANIPLSSISFLNHGTTVGINTLLEKKGARTGIIATEGFRDCIELRRGARTHVLDPLMDKPPSFVPRRQRVGIKERIMSDGTVLTPLSKKETRKILAEFIESNQLESLAVCLLNSYANSQHEDIVKTIVNETFPHISQTLSSLLVPEIGEYERTSTTTLNAYIQPTIATYLSKLNGRLKDAGLKVPIHIMQSNGGAMTTAEATDRPIHILESGPAAGSIAAAKLATTCGSPNVITLDMGGTTTKASVIEEGVPLSTTEYELFKDDNRPGSGLPLKVPMIDIVEIGSGGGSIISLDQINQIHIGPESAGSNPGPVCYGNGGILPTITDANAALGRVTSLLSGSMKLDVALSKKVLQQTVGDPLGISYQEAASGVLEIADAKTADVIREITIARGKDPRDFDLIAFGGAGPLQAANVVKELELRKAIIPVAPGNFSAIGLLSTDLIYDSVTTHITTTANLDKTRWNKLLATFDRLENELTNRLNQTGIDTESFITGRMIDMRYVGQFHYVTIPFNSNPKKQSQVEALTTTFHEEHQRLFTYMCPQDQCEIVNLRVRITGNLPRFNVPLYNTNSELPRTQYLPTIRNVYFRETQTELPTPIYTRSNLRRGTSVQGPAIIEEHTSTTLVPPDFCASLDNLGNIILEQA